MSRPISAMITRAAVTPTPGISSSRATVCAKGAICASIRSSKLVMSPDSASIRPSILASRNAWWSVNCPTNACSNVPILPRIEERASCASTRGSRCPATSASSIARPDTPKMSEATTDSLICASSSSFSTRFFSPVRSAISATR